MAKIYSIINQKGGVGKTTTTINLGTAMAACGANVLIIDMDPQGNLSTGMGVEKVKREKGVYNILIDNLSINDAVIKTEIPNLNLIPSNEDLLGIDIELSNESDRVMRLKKALEDLNSYDYILLDCPPSLSLLTLNALVASTGALVPLQAEFYALEGLSQLLKTIEGIKNSVNHDLMLEGVIITMFDGRNNLSNQVEQDVRSYLGTEVFTTKIPRNIRLSEAPSHGLPALIYDHKCSGSAAYINLAREVLNKSGWVIE
ncbi:MAG: chromosome partitioning protein ParA [Rhodobiaceae bacterium]|jgi:chromosome partitioning protein|nr:chromosome partitioning protein ParA [Rhodobiaceae bacterium]|tara:strand:- start:78 stop:851 length:774 start_codon:yes stop_codon:yes gene_type:complete